MSDERRSCDGKHFWPRQCDSRTSSGYGDREVWTCNNCLATKVIITTHQKDNTVDTVEQIVEPAPRKP